ncbi:BIRC2_3 [Mytilus coruscus]|uniref:BIRC2_3 n=1 Tax=Mytilus coruscus TaxID=42192 RepID=A0A6J8DTU4_MYTCO|nr:BIRC2_3 [Mytilus coruscus]
MDIYIKLLILITWKYDWATQEGFKFNFTLDVISRASGYGGSVTLLCKFEGCCSTFAAWEVWEKGSDDDFKPIFTDVTNLRLSKTSKYDGSIRPDGYTLIIRNLSEADLNMNYTCTYGSYRSDKKLLLEEDVLYKVSYTTDTTRKPNNDNGVRLGTSVGVALIMILVTLVSILFCWYRRCRRKSRSILEEPDQIGHYEEMTSMIYVPESNYDQYHGKILPKDDVKIYCLCSNRNSDKDYTRELKRILMNYGFKSENIKSNVDFLPGKLFYEIPQESLKDILKLIIVISDEYELDGHFSQFIDLIVNLFIKEKKFADIIPILRSETVEIPRCLSNRTPFSQVTDSYSKLVDGLLQCPIIQQIEGFGLSLSNSSTIIASTAQNITDFDIKPDKLICFQHDRDLIIQALDDWGVHIDNERLIVHIDIIQKNSQNRHICLESIFARRMKYIKCVRFVRLYGVEQFNLKQLELHSHMEKQVSGVFKILINKLNESKCWWYHYRRNGLRPIGSSEETFRLMKQILQDGEPVIIYPQFATFQSRLTTFSDYPIENKSFKEKMARAGFFYFHVSDYVQCFQCGGCLCKWSNIHDPVLRHKAYFKNCHFMEHTYPRYVSESDIKGLCNDKMQHFVGRLDSFKQFQRQFPAQKNITEDDKWRLADNGFYYCGIAEDIACYACDIGYTTMQYSTQISKTYKKQSPYCPHVPKGLIKTSENEDDSKHLYSRKAFDQYMPYLEPEYHRHKGIFNVEIL